MSFGYFLAFMQPTKELTDQRRLFQKSIGPRGVEEYDSFLIHGSSELLQGLDGFSGQPMDVLVKTLGNALTRIAYGEHFFQHHGEEIIEKNVEALELLSWAVTKFWLVDLIPALRYIPAWFPGANFKHVGNKGKNCADTIRYWPIDRVNAASSKGISDNSILSKYRNEGGFSEESVRDAVAIMYIGGIDTTTATVTHFLFSITLYSNWQKLIQEEMDQVLGRGTIPTIEDIPKLKIFNAVFKESLRWIPAAPIGLPHVSSKEDVWNGYYIPRGSIVHCNIGFVWKP
ncbi:SubName: Full=Uncharacterized protein {ECO:0000313/EMBL:CCA71478.1} [Serendipita indica DSM 11827]|uniref:O-methylsterigmatocystin oxidoreductase n=1 Tax=Serendipita indica (strain DSM 11827) TaxID=1109443 RepID=G4TJI3_SERID|nr:SubName: Full=Uncharacterized protein {ECO:0000313/EMBL:CCA71478.1} [Serendipita indica DSM 11827]CCA71478.1 hypothetical protein PIIN_05417 [Serendipita indica DSM 11827]